MVSATGVCVLFVMLAGGAHDAAPLSLQCWVVEGSREDRETPLFDAEAQRVQDALADLQFDTWRTLHSRTVQLPAGEDMRIPLKERYTLILHYIGLDEDNRARVTATVELAPKEPDDEPCNVLQTILLLSREKVRIGGLRTEAGELVLVFSPQ